MNDSIEKSFNRRRLRIFAVTALALAYLPLPAWAGLKETIAAKFGVDQSASVLNLPPRPGCLPGSIFTDDLRLPLARTKADDPSLDYGPTFQFDANVDFDAGGAASVGVSQWLGLTASAGASSEATMTFTDAKVVELLGPELKRRVLADPTALAAAAKNVPPFAVIRAFLGKVTVTLAKRKQASADVWGKVKQIAVDVNAGAHVTDDDKVVIAVAQPFVFGFEVVQVNYLTQHLGSKVDDAELVPVPDDLFQR